MLVLLGLAAGGATAYLSYVQPVAAAVQRSTGQVVPRPPEATPAPTPAGLDGSRRLNILLLGSDTDVKFVGVYDTQIMMVVSIDPQRKQVSMLSIPRDLWVQIPGWGMGKIGTAYHDGGLALARQTVEQDLQIPIDYYAWVGLDGFVKVIDTLGGVDLDVMHPIVDDRYPDDLNNTADPYAYRRLYIPAGPQHLDGVRALEYVRSRHGDLLGDFGRSQRQQQLLEALRAKSGQAIAANLPQIALDLQGSVRTDLTLVDLAKFATFADQLKGQGVRQFVLSPPTYSSDGTSNDGQSIVIPNWPAIRQLVGTLQA